MTKLDNKIITIKETEYAKMITLSSLENMAALSG